MTDVTPSPIHLHALPLLLFFITCAGACKEKDVVYLGDPPASEKGEVQGAGKTTPTAKESLKERVDALLEASKIDEASALLLAQENSDSQDIIALSKEVDKAWFAKVRGELDTKIKDRDWIAVGSFLAMMSEWEEFGVHHYGPPTAWKSWESIEQLESTKERKDLEAIYFRAMAKHRAEIMSDAFSLALCENPSDCILKTHTALAADFNADAELASAELATKTVIIQGTLLRRRTRGDRRVFVIGDTSHDPDSKDSIHARLERDDPHLAYFDRLELGTNVMVACDGSITKPLAILAMGCNLSPIAWGVNLKKGGLPERRALLQATRAANAKLGAFNPPPGLIFATLKRP